MLARRMTVTSKMVNIWTMKNNNNMSMMVKAVRAKTWMLVNNSSMASLRTSTWHLTRKTMMQLFIKNWSQPNWPGNVRKTIYVCYLIVSSCSREKRVELSRKLRLLEKELVKLSINEDETWRPRVTSSFANKWNWMRRHKLLSFIKRRKKSRNRKSCTTNELTAKK